MVGNKSDMESTHREVPRQLAREFKNEHDLAYEGESSARNGANIDKIFADLAKSLYMKHKDEPRRGTID
jgi:hypothetical protein